MEAYPKKVRTICIVSMVFAAFGILSTLSGLAGSAVPQPKIPNVSKENDKMLEAQREMYAGLEELTEEYRPYQLTLFAVIPVVSIAILIGGIMALRHDEGGLKILLPSLWIAVPVALANGVIGILIASKTSTVMTHYMQQVMEATTRGQSPEAGFENLFSNIMSLSIHFGMGVSATWLLCKVGFFIYAAITLKNPNGKRITPPPLPVR